MDPFPVACPGPSLGQNFLGDSKIQARILNPRSAASRDQVRSIPRHWPLFATPPWKERGCKRIINLIPGKAWNKIPVI
jgi:hypothetical protein